MNSSQHPLTLTTPFGAESGDETLNRWAIDEDVALGCECANPALQIERWGQEAPAPMHAPC